MLLSIGIENINKPRYHDTGRNYTTFD